MKYLKLFKMEDEWKEVDYNTALRTLLGSYKDTEDVRNMLNEEGYIKCMFSFIRVVEES